MLLEAFKLYYIFSHLTVYSYVKLITEFCADVETNNPHDGAFGHTNKPLNLKRTWYSVTQL